jgi:hypothetical protein
MAPNATRGRTRRRASKTSGGPKIQASVLCASRRHGPAAGNPATSEEACSDPNPHEAGVFGSTTIPGPAGRAQAESCLSPAKLMAAKLAAAPTYVNATRVTQSHCRLCCPILHSFAQGKCVSKN